MEKVRLELIGITYNQIESGVYAVILQQSGGTRRIPIIIGYPEAQAIECKLQDVVTPRPLTHDLMANALSAFGIRLEEVNIRKLPSGIFAASLLLTDGESTQTIDSRSSDAIALAIRVGAPIYTTPQVLEEAGFEPGERQRKESLPETKQPRITTKAAPQAPSSSRGDLSRKSLEELNRDMQAAAENEDYEEAARIKAEIDSRPDQEKI